jgi:hypothetical protein
MNHSEFNILLQKSFRDQAVAPRNVRLPTDAGIRIGGDIACATLFLSAAAVQANMQNDAAAFESWAVVLKVWCGVRRITVDWQEPADTGNGHYQRFLYRLGHFEELFGRELLGVVGRERLAQCRVGNGAAATLNLAGNRDTAAMPSVPGSEADLEKRLAGANLAERARLMAALGLVQLDRQMPVGVFDGPPTRVGAIFTGGKSAIDLVGVDGTGALWLLELKTPRNIKVGALSELFFYSMVLNDARLGRIVFHDKSAGPRSTITSASITAAPRIHARVLAEASHPLLSPAVFDTLNKAAAARGWAVDYGFHDLACYLDKITKAHAPERVRAGLAK